MFSEASAKALAAAIESLEPSAVTLESNGFVFQLAQYLAAVIRSGAPDLSELRSHGIEVRTAVEICEAIGARHARVAAAAKPKPKVLPPLPYKPEPTAEQIDRESALSLLHTLCEMIGAERACPTELNRTGFGWATSKELANLINATRN
jgi:hypothetical protein